jgi:RHS repeat-associated protein
LVAEVNATNKALVQTFTWGLDVSGSIKESGGVGGMLMVNNATNGASFAAYDGNGNVIGLTSASDGKWIANYEYSSFGEIIRATGPMAQTNPFRFSTKYWDVESDLINYGYRYYSPNAGRWINRDPIQEAGGANYYAFVRNNPINLIDYYGLEPVPSSTIQSIIRQWAALNGGSTQVGNLCGVNVAVNRILSALNRISVIIDPSQVSSTAVATYKSNYKTIFLRNGSPDGTLITHELIHAYNDVNNVSYKNDPRRDEGVAYSLTSFYPLVIPINCR